MGNNVRPASSLKTQTQHQLAEKRNFVSISIEDGLHHHFSIIRSAVSSAQSWLSKTHQQDLDLTIQEFSSYQLKIKASKCCSSLEIKVPDFTVFEK